MTVIFGECHKSKVFLAADTRRRDHITGHISYKDKIHKLSDKVIITQGGAGSGAADVMVLALKKLSNPSVDDVIAACQSDGPSIMKTAAENWASNNLTIPTTFVIAASVNDAGFGLIRSINLATGAVQGFDNQFVSGTHTPQAVSVLGGLRGSARGFDWFAVASVAQLQNEFPADIGLPVDVAVVQKEGQSFSACINRLGSNFFADNRFRF